MSDAPVVPGPLYGLRTWASDGRRLTGPHLQTPWPAGGAWLEASCERHAAPAPDCQCGVHALHPNLRSAQRVLAGRREIGGVVEAEGAVEVHEDGFRAQRGRPYALFAPPWRDAEPVRRLAEAYHVEVVTVRRPADAVAWCARRHLGLTPSTVERLLGPGTAERRRRRRRHAVLRVVAAVVVCALLVLVGLEVLTDPPGPRVLHGRAGEVHVR